MTATWPPPDRPCKKEVEFCSCGRQMIRTVERSSIADSDTGIKPLEAWHSCPRYFVPLWRNLLTLGTSGMGHQSHEERNPIAARAWR